MAEGKAKTKITADFVLDLYEKSKKAKGKASAELLQTAKTLSKHLNEWLVVADNLKKK
jgi:hypothetical protein